ncbi:hypothetical protein SAMN04487969_1388 [Paenibacillus algorifonticola]|uniref:Uncharacterized protein n=1 Tax=Paenibacillus algorifonticola TaxID=684063 RepID=A0A1I2IMY1_9BACL|nr:hypothetical protein [Paenibacillus algorifonticola]SFF42993.1 hypothetical protein SAMN04487969_1388 [Paenibacillus algorifonticola]
MMEKLTRAVLEEEQKDQRNFPTAEVLKARPKLLAAMALLATIMLFRHPAALNGAAGCFSFRGEGQNAEARGGPERQA